MSLLVESCDRCDWSAETPFRYHGGVPVEHLVCPRCGEPPQWAYHFDRSEIEHSPAEMVTYIRPDEAAFPEDQSPAYLVVDAALKRALDDSDTLRIDNHAGVVDVAMQPYLDHARGLAGVALVANVGHSVASIALVELLAVLNGSLELGRLIADRSGYGHLVGPPPLLPFGTELGLTYLHLVSLTSIEDGSWTLEYEAFVSIAVQLARDFAGAQRLQIGEGPSELSYLPTRGPLHGSSAEGGLGEVEGSILGPLLLVSPDADEINARMERFVEELGLALVRDEAGDLLFALDSARVRVSLQRRGSYLLVRFHASILDDVPLAPGEAEEIPALLTTLNNQITFGRCVIEPIAGEEHRGRIVLDKTLLAADLDLSEFAVTLAVFADQADQMDDILQAEIGGLRADQLTEGAVHASDLEPLIRQLADGGPRWFHKLGAHEAREQIRHMLEELSLPVDEDDDHVLWFEHGSARFGCGLWHDERATFLEVRASVLRDLPKTTGLAAALNAINRQIHFGAFALSGGGESVELVETLVADDLALEELAYALITIGQLADDYDDPLKARFGGLLGTEEAP